MKKSKIKIPNISINQGSKGALTEIELKLHGFNSSSNEDPQVNLKYFDSSYQCFSDWQPQELKSFSSFLRTISSMSWIDILKSGGKSGTKTGLGMTYHKDRGVLPKTTQIDKISEDINFFELRVTERARVHGFRSSCTFFLVFLDREHGIYPE